MAILSVLIVPFALQVQAMELTDKNYADYRAKILPSVEEQTWQRVPWQPNLWSAVLEATRQDKPILLWAMNGHPMACT